MSRLRDKIFEQHNIGKYWGRFALAGSQIAIFVSGYTFLMVSVNVYEPISRWLTTQGINISFLVFMTVILLPIVLAYLFSWKFLVRSFYVSWAEQFWRENSPALEKLDRDIESIKQTQVEILGRLDKEA